MSGVVISTPSMASAGWHFLQGSSPNHAPETLSPCLDRPGHLTTLVYSPSPLSFVSDPFIKVSLFEPSGVNSVSC